MTNKTTTTDGCNAAIKTALMAYASAEASARAEMADDGELGDSPDLT